MSIKTYHDLLLPGVRGRIDADLHEVGGELWIGRETGPRVMILDRKEARSPWPDIRLDVESRFKQAERVFGRTPAAREWDEANR